MIEQLLEIKLNCSAIFLLSPLRLSYNEVKKVGFVNSYLKLTEERDVSCDNPLYLLFKKPINDGGKFSDFLIGQYAKNDNLIEEIDCENYTILIYCIPEEFNGDFELFLSGKYSKFSRKFKSKFDKYVKDSDELSFHYKVMSKSPEWKKEVEEFFNTPFDSGDELWSKPNVENETLNLNKICTTQL